MDGQNMNNEQNNMYQDYTVDPVVVVEEKPNNTLAIVSLVMGILSILLCCCFGVGIIFGIIGIVCAIMAKNKGQSKGLVIAGLVCSIVGCVFSVASIAYWVYCFALAAESMNDPAMLEEIMNSYYGY